ncbi:MAG: molybdopterin-dependent oxidoreductase [Polyangiaceae bacterium]
MPTVYRTCNLCEAMCGLAITVEQGKITRIEGDEEDVLSRGHVCPKGPALKEIFEDPDRVRRPLRRTRGGLFEPTSWDSALAECGEKIARIQEKHGKDAVAAYYGNPAVHSHGAILMTQLLSLVLGTKNKFDANSADANPKLFACERLFGDMAALTVPDVDRTEFFLMLGANPLASNGSLMSMGDVRGRMKGLKERGARLVVVDPRRTETAKIADLHLPIRPGTDPALLMGILHVLFERGLVDEKAVSRIATGLAELRAAVSGFTAERAARATGIDAKTITELAADFAKAERAVAYGRMGICTGPESAVASFLVEALNVVTGNFDRPGGMMFATPAIDLSKVARSLGVSGAGRFFSRVRKLPEVGGQLPNATLADEIETPGEGQIRGLVTVAGNPALSVPNGDRLSRALAGLEFMVSVDLFLNETTRHAHVLLPVTPALARPHFDVVLHALAVRNTAKWSEASVPADGDTRDDWTALRDLSRSIAKARGGLSMVAVAALDLLSGMTDEQAIDMLLRMGPYGDRFLPWKDGLSLEQLRAAPHGIDFGPLKPCREERVHKPGHKADLAPADVIAEIKRAAKAMDREAEGLVLIGRRHLRSNNSWMHNCPSLVKGQDRSSLFVHPADAEARGLAEGAEALVTSRVGQVAAKVVVTDEVMRGVVSLPHGFGHRDAKDTMRVAGALGGASMNSVTDDSVVDPLTGTAVLNGVPVRVEAYVRSGSD